MSKVNTYEEFLLTLSEIPEGYHKEFIFETLSLDQNLHLFAKYFFPHVIEGQEETPEIHLDLYNELANKKDKVCIMPRGYSKSTISKIFIIKKIVYDEEPVIVYVGNTMTDAQLHFASIKSELENNSDLIDIYGDLTPTGKKKRRKWSDKHFETSNGVSCIARGAGKGRGININNQRPTLIIMDDIEDDESVRNPQRREKTEQWVDQVMIPSLDPNRGRIKWIGTVLHTACIVLKKYNQWGGIFRKAIENGQSTWASRFSILKLDEIRKKIGTRGFSQEYLNNPTNEDMAIMDAQWIDSNTFVALTDEDKRLMRYVIVIDPQSGESDLADEYCITVIGWVPKDKHRYVLYQKSGRTGVTNQAKYLIETWLTYPTALVVGIEKILAQTALYQTVLAWKSGQIKIEGITTKNKNIPAKAIDPKGKNKVDRLKIHEPAFERGEIHLKPEMRKARDQLLFLGQDILDHDDCADSIIMALDLSYSNNSKLSDSNNINKKTVTAVGNIREKKF